MTIHDRELGRQLYFYLKSYDPNQNRTLTSVAREFGVTRQYIRRLAKQYNVPLHFVEQKGNSVESALHYVPTTPKLVQVVRVQPSVVESEMTRFKLYTGTAKKNRGKAPTQIPTDKQAYLLENYALKPITHLIKESGLSEYIVKRFLLENDLKRPTQSALLREQRRQRKEARLAKKEVGQKAKVKKLKRKGRAPTDLPADVEAYLRDNCNQPWSQLANTVGYSYTIVKGFMSRKGYVRERTQTEPRPRQSQRKVIPDKVQAFLKENYARPWSTLSKECGLTVDVIRRFMRENGLQRPKKGKPNRPVGEQLKRGKKRHEFSEQDKEFMTSDFSKPITEIAKELGVSPAIVKRYLVEEGLYTVKTRSSRLKGA